MRALPLVFAPPIPVIVSHISLSGYLEAYDPAERKRLSSRGTAVLFSFAHSMR